MYRRTVRRWPSQVAGRRRAVVKTRSSWPFDAACRGQRPRRRSAAARRTEGAGRGLQFVSDAGVLRCATTEIAPAGDRPPAGALRRRPAPRQHPLADPKLAPPLLALGPDTRRSASTGRTGLQARKLQPPTASRSWRSVDAKYNAVSRDRQGEPSTIGAAVRASDRGDGLHERADDGQGPPAPGAGAARPRGQESVRRRVTNARRRRPRASTGASRGSRRSASPQLREGLADRAEAVAVVRDAARARPGPTACSGGSIRSAVRAAGGGAGDRLR